MIKSGVTKKTPANILFGAGVFFTGVTYNEKAAPAESEIKAKLIGATQEGGKITIVPEWFTPDVDGVYVPLREMRQKVGETCSIETTMIELTAEHVARQVIGEINDSTDGEYDVITSAELRAGHFYEGFGYYGHLQDGRQCILLMKQALCTSGFSNETKHGENAKFSGTFECQGDIEYGTEHLPYAIFIRKPEGWVSTVPEEITGA